MNEKIEDVVSDEELIKVWGNANFGSTDKREIVRNSLLKCACRYYTGKTAKQILEELSLVTTKWELTPKGRNYLWVAYSNGLSV